MAYTVVNNHELPGNSTSYQFEGGLHGDANVSFFLSVTPPGRGPELHQHPYEEIFIVQAGQLLFSVGDEQVTAGAGQIVIVPPQTPHKFINCGNQVAQHVDIHASKRMSTTWLEQRANV
jgi:mannose-6-phosphate isomerase-like protein (cupin superfamily)